MLDERVFVTCAMTLRIQVCSAIEKAPSPSCSRQSLEITWTIPENMQQQVTPKFHHKFLSALFFGSILGFVGYFLASIALYDSIGANLRGSNDGAVGGAILGALFGIYAGWKHPATKLW